MGRRIANEEKSIIGSTASADDAKMLHMFAASGESATTVKQARALGFTAAL